MPCQTVRHAVPHTAIDGEGFGALRGNRGSMTREKAAAKWNCSPGTIDKYAA